MNLGEGIEYNESPILAIQSQYKALPLRERDIKKAKSLLAEAGYPNGLTVELYFASDYPFSKELAQTVQELALPAGFDIKLKGMTRDIYLSQYWLNVPLSITGWGGRVDPYMMLAVAFRGGAIWSESHYDNPRVIQLIDLISEEIDDATRLAYYHELQEIFYEEGPLLNVQVPLLVALSDKVIEYRTPLTMIPQYKYTDIL